MSNEPVQSIDGIVEGILEQAIKMKGSDVHIDPEREGLSVRVRVDGLLYSIEGIDQTHTQEIISKIKVMAEIDITEKRLSQDGHLEFQFNDKVYDFRVSTTPTIYGESVAMRILNRDGIVVSFSELGFTKEQLDTVNRIINSPFGIVLITGPTGSGKTTVLYSFLNQLNKPERNIVTLEDPVEYQMTNIKQMQINEAIGWDFAKGMRSVIRQDPDIIMLGEVRDAQTASMAFQAALSGRLVLSTFHTFDVPGIVIRLIEMGLPRSVIAHSLTGVITSRLVKKICTKCITDYTPSEDDLKKLGIDQGNYSFKRGAGCEVCYNSGYSGRTGIYQVILFDDEIKENIMENRSDISLGQLLNKKNFSTLRQNGIEAVVNGITTIDEVVRVLGY